MIILHPLFVRYDVYTNGDHHDDKSVMTLGMLALSEYTGLTVFTIGNLGRTQPRIKLSGILIRWITHSH